MAKLTILKTDEKIIYYHADSLAKAIRYWHLNNDLVIVVDSLYKEKDLTNSIKPEFGCFELNITKMALPGLIASDLLSLLKSHAIPAISLNGISLFSTDTDKNLSIDDFLMENVLKIKYVPILNPMASDKAGNVTKVDTDAMLSFLYKKLNANEMVIISNDYEEKGLSKKIESLKIYTAKELSFIDSQSF